MRCANPPTTLSRSSSTSTNQSSSSGKFSTRARKPLTSSGVYVEPPPMTATLSILFFDACNDDSLHEEALCNKEQNDGEDECQERTSLNELRLLSIDAVERRKSDRNRPILPRRGEIDQRTEVIIPREDDVEHDHCNDNRVRLREDNGPKNAQRAGTVHHG